NAGQPNQSGPNQCVDPNAPKPNQSVDPNANQPNQCVEPRDEEKEHMRRLHEAEQDLHDTLGEEALKEGGLHAAEGLARAAGVKVAEGSLSVAAAVAEISLGPGDTTVGPKAATKWWYLCHDDHGEVMTRGQDGIRRSSREEAQRDADQHNQNWP